MNTIRKASRDEQRLLEILVERADLQLPIGWRETLLVQSMEDGGMGSLLLFPHGVSEEKRLHGNVASELEFKDEDGVDVLVTLNLDKDEQLFEIDSWKVDFSPLIRIPDDI